MKKNIPIIIGIIVIVAVAVMIMINQRKNALQNVSVETDTTATTTPQVINATPEAVYAPSVPLEGTVFKIVALNGKLAPGIGDYTVSFSEGKLQAQFCNGLGGEYAIKDFVITAPNVMSTLMFCEKPDGLMNMEQTFGKMITAGARYTITGDVLELKAGEDKMILQAK